jgi:hypothetical protein
VKPKGPARELRFIAVHVISEGFDLGAAAPAVRAELAAKAPDASARLGSIWKRLTREVRVAIEAAWELEVQGAPPWIDRRRKGQNAVTSAQAGADGRQK